MATKTHYKYVVIGCGGIGSGTLYWLSRRAGPDVLGLEQFRLGHDNGGSQDYSRIIRLMYDKEIYTKLTPHTYEAWHEVEQESGLQLVYKTGSLDLTEKDTPREHIFEQYAASMAKSNIPFERLSSTELRKRFPQFQCDDKMIALYQRDGGLVDAALGNAVHIQLARARGATILDNCPLQNIQVLPDGRVKLHTPQGIFTADRVLVTAGAWINNVLNLVGANIPVIVTQEQVTYSATPNIKDFTKSNFPVFIYHGERLDIYGLPIHGNSGCKIGIDAGGNQVSPKTRNFIPDPKREKLCLDFWRKNIPGALGPILLTKTCLYTMTKDRDFVIDTLSHQGTPQIIVCCGAGHAYKFASLLGRILSELAVDGRTRYDISGFTMNREAITNPSFKPTYHFGIADDDLQKAKL